MGANGKTVPGISFGPFFLDTAGRRLFREGRRVPATPIELKLLETLLRNRERVLTGDELRLLVWSEDPSIGIAPAQDANALYVAIRKLRRALGDYGKLIVNIPKVGYSISEEAEVETVDADRSRAIDDGPPFVGRRIEIEDIRHRTLEDAVDWSYSLLTEEERIFLRRLSVFAGGWTLDTAREICSGDGVEKKEVVHLLAQLVRRSLVQLSVPDRRQRYSMLETIRQFGRKYLHESGEEERVFARHTRHFLELAENAFEAGGNVDWLVRTDEEYDNVRSVLERTIRERRGVEIGLRMCGALAKYWFNHGHFREAKFWTRQALEADDGSYPAPRAVTLRTAGFFFGQLAGVGEDPQSAKIYFEQSLAIWRELGAEKEEAFTLVHYAFLLYRLGLLDNAREAAQKGLDLSSAAGDHANIARSANNLALTWLEVGEFEQARSIFEIALAAARNARDKYLEGLSLHYLGETALRTGELVQAKECLTRSLALCELLGNRPLAARTQLLHGEVTSSEGNFAEALRLQREALKDLSEIEDTQGIAAALEALACTHAEEGRSPDLFLTLRAAAARLRSDLRIPLGPARGRAMERYAESVAAALDERSVRAAEEKGRTMSVTQAVEFASNAS